MADLLYIAVMVAFFALAAGFVAACDRIIAPGGSGSDPETPVEHQPDEPKAAPQPVA